MIVIYSYPRIYVKKNNILLKILYILKYFETDINYELNISADGFNKYLILYVWIMNIQLNAFFLYRNLVSNG